MTDFLKLSNLRLSKNSRRCSGVFFIYIFCCWNNCDDERRLLSIRHIHLLQRIRLHETRSELRPVWHLKSLWKVIPFTWRFHCANFPNHSKTLLQMCKWYLLINAKLIDAKQMSWYWLLFQQQQQSTWVLVIKFNDSAQLYFTASIYCLHGKLTAVWNFTSVKLIEVKFAPKWVLLRPKSRERW